MAAALQKLLTRPRRALKRSKRRFVDAP